MPATEEDRQLLELLEQQPILGRRQFSFDCGPTGGIVVSRRAHVIGVWHFDGSAFTWTPAGYNTPTQRVTMAEEALRYTSVVLATKT